MPLKLSVGLAKKIGQPGYGSLSANCNIEVELDDNLLENDSETFQRQVRNGYAACSKAIHEELARQQANEGPAADSPQTGATTRSNGAAGKAGDAAPTNGSSPRRASQKQLDYAGQLAAQIKGLGTRRLESLAGKMYGKPLADLSSLEASGLIDMLKEIKADKVNLADALNGAAA